MWAYFTQNSTVKILMVMKHVSAKNHVLIRLWSNGRRDAADLISCGQQTCVSVVRTGRGAQRGECGGSPQPRQGTPGTVCV